MFATAHEDDEPEREEEPPSRGVALWLVAAGSLVIGILIGFASGYTAADRGSPAAAAATEAEAAPSASTSPSATTQTFTENDVAERAEPPPAAPEPASEPLPDRPPPPAPTRAAEPARERAVTPPPAPRTAIPAPRADGPPAEPRAAAVVQAGTNQAGTSAPGSMQVLSRPSGAQVVLDGRVIGKTPMTLPDVPTGTHDVRLDLPGFRPWATSIEIAPGERTRVAASLEQ